MKTKILGLLAVGLLAGPMAAKAAYVYEFNFDAAEDTIGSYSAASFSFVTPTLLLAVGDSASVSPASDLNGYAVTQTTVNQRVDDVISFSPDGLFGGDTTGTSAGDVIFYFFYVTNYFGGTGTFATDFAGRDISYGDGQGSVYLFTTGSLVIREATVPEPGTLALLGLGLAGLGLSRRRKAN